MCEHCWEEAGAPKIDNERVRAAAELCREFDDGAVTFPLANVFEDWNVEDEHIASELVFLELKGRTLTLANPDKTLDLARRVLEALQGLTVPERHSALALAEGLWSRT